MRAALSILLLTGFPGTTVPAQDGAHYPVRPQSLPDAEEIARVRRDLHDPVVHAALRRSPVTGFASFCWRSSAPVAAAFSSR